MNAQKLSGILLHASHGLFASLLFFVRPVVVIDGRSYRKAWRCKFFFPLEPGEHQIAVYWRLLFVPNCRFNSLTVHVQEGQVAQVSYFMPGLIFARGRLALEKSVNRRAKPTQSPLVPMVMNCLEAVVSFIAIVIGLAIIYESSGSAAIREQASTVFGIGATAWLGFTIACFPFEFFRIKRSLPNDDYQRQQQPTHGAAFPVVFAGFVALCLILIAIAGLPIALGTAAAGQRDTEFEQTKSDNSKATNVVRSGIQLTADEAGSDEFAVEQKPRPAQVHPKCVIIGSFDRILTGRHPMNHPTEIAAPQGQKIVVVEIRPLDRHLISTQQEAAAYAEAGGALASLNVSLNFAAGTPHLFAHDKQFQILDNRGGSCPCWLVLRDDSLNNRVTGSFQGEQLFAASDNDNREPRSIRVFAFLPDDRVPEAIQGYGLGLDESSALQLVRDAADDNQ